MWSAKPIRVEPKEITVEAYENTNEKENKVIVHWYGAGGLGISKIEKIRVKGKTIPVEKYRFEKYGDVVIMTLPKPLYHYGVPYIVKYNLITIYYM